MKRFLRYLSHSFILAVMLFAVVRLSYDMTLGEDYWSDHTRKFIFTELLLTWGCFLSGIVVTPVFIRYIRKHHISPLPEYLTVTLFAVGSVLVVIFISHSIDTEAVSFRHLALPLIITSLFSCLYYSYIVDSERKRELSEQALMLEKIRSTQLDTELRLLRAQYHPHFLFNMLNTIYVQIDEANETPRHTIECLSEVLRYQLYSPEMPADIESELDVMQKYIELCRLRASRSLKLDINIGTYPKEMKIYPLLLIPLIENAFKHVGGNRHISISFGMVNQMLQLRVRNTVAALPKASATASSGIGLENLRRRIEVLYPGNQHQLTIDSDAGHFTATLRLKPIGHLN